VTAAQVLSELRRLGLQVEAAGGRLRTLAPAQSLTPLRPPVVEHRDPLLELVGRSCPPCGEVDYLPLTGGWRRCWACGARWGAGRDPGDPPGLQRLAELLGVGLAERVLRQPGARRPGWSIRAVLACPRCGNRVYSTPPAGRPHRRCDGPRGCGHTWNPEAP
jgi:hypothetical protein